MNVDESTYLMVVDMQRVFATPKSPWYVHSFAALEKPITRWYGKFTIDTVIFTRFVPPSAKPGRAKGAWQAYYAKYPFARDPKNAALFDLAAPYDDWPGGRHTATTFDKWSSLPSHLKARIKTLYLCGVSTACCVLSTALAAADAGIRVRIVRDATAAVSQDMVTAVLRILPNYAPLIAFV